jgi:hypothetical protein
MYGALTPPEPEFPLRDGDENEERLADILCNAGECLDAAEDLWKQVAAGDFDSAVGTLRLMRAKAVKIVEQEDDDNAQWHAAECRMDAICARLGI